MRVHSKNRKLSVKKNKTNRKRQQRNKRSAKSRVRGGVIFDFLNKLGNNPGPYSRENNSVPRYEKVGDNIYINEGFELSEVDENGYGGRPIRTGAYKLEPTNNPRNLYNPANPANPAIYVHGPSLQDPVKKARIETDIKMALRSLSPVQASTDSSVVEIHPDLTLSVSSDKI